MKTTDDARVVANRCIKRGIRGIIQGIPHHAYVGPGGIALHDPWSPFNPKRWCLWDRYDPHRKNGNIKVLRDNLTEEEAMLAAYGIDIR